MTLHQLKIFIVVARRSSIKAAAEELRIAQPSISRQIQLLAEELGTALHKRKGQGIELTPAGRFFAPEAKALVARIERLGAKGPAAVVQKTPPELTVGGSYGPSVTLLPTVLTRFRKIHPEVNLYLRTDNRLVIEKLLLDNQLDLAVLNNTTPHRRLMIEPFRVERTVTFVAPHHPLAKKGRLESSPNRRIGLVIRRPPRGYAIGERYLQSLRKHGFSPYVIMYCDSAEAIKTAVAKTAGIGVLSISVVEKEIKSGVFKEIVLPGEAFQVKSSIVYPKGRQLSPIAREFIELLRQY